MNIIIWTILFTLTFINVSGQTCEINPNIDLRIKDNLEIYNLWKSYYSDVLANAENCHFFGWSDKEKISLSSPDLLLQEGVYSPNIYYFKYKCQLLAIKNLGDEKLIKIIFYSVENKFVEVHAIISLLCLKENEKFVLSNAINYYTKNWNSYTIGKISYYYYPEYPFNIKDAQKANKLIDSLISWFNLSKSIKIKYYIANNCEEIQKLRGFDFVGYYGANNLNLCGYFDSKNYIVFANSKEGANYEHEIIHIINKHYPNCHSLILMGLSLYINSENSGHLGKPAAYHIKIINEYLKKNSSLDLNDLASFYSIDEPTNPQYVNGAIIIHEILKKGNLPLLVNAMQNTKTDYELYKFLEKYILPKKTSLNDYIRAKYQLYSKEVFSNLLSE